MWNVFGFRRHVNYGARAAVPDEVLPVTIGCWARLSVHHKAMQGLDMPLLYGLVSGVDKSVQKVQRLKVIFDFAFIALAVRECAAKVHVRHLLLG